MLRRALVVVAAVAALALAACGHGPSEPMPGDEEMLVPTAVGDSVAG
jgi:hypothetical protein